MSRLKLRKAAAPASVAEAIMNLETQDMVKIQEAKAKIREALELLQEPVKKDFRLEDIIVNPVVWALNDLEAYLKTL